MSDTWVKDKDIIPGDKVKIIYENGDELTTTVRYATVDIIKTPRGTIQRSERILRQSRPSPIPDPQHDPIIYSDGLVWAWDNNALLYFSVITDPEAIIRSEKPYQFAWRHWGRMRVELEGQLTLTYAEMTPDQLMHELSEVSKDVGNSQDVASRHS